MNIWVLGTIIAGVFHGMFVYENEKDCVSAMAKAPSSYTLQCVGYQPVKK
jgi:hypothetical protein